MPKSNGTEGDRNQCTDLGLVMETGVYFEETIVQKVLESD